MLKKCLQGAMLLLIGVHLWLPVPAAAQDDDLLLVLPFTVNAGPEYTYLREDVPALLREQLETAGLETLDRQATEAVLGEEEPRTDDMAWIRRQVREAGADAAIAGSVSLIGETVSLDASLVRASGLTEARAFYVTRKGLIHLLPAVTELAGKIQDALLVREKIHSVTVRGNETLGDDFVLMRLETTEGSFFKKDVISRDIETLFETGYFEDIEVHAESTEQGRKVIFEVEEKPLLQSIEIQGAEAIDEDDLLAAMSTKTGSVINLSVIRDDLQRIKQMYREKGYYQCQVDFSRERVESEKVKLVISLDEGKKLYIQGVRIQGAEKLDEGELKDQLALSERGLFSWITGSGVLNEELLDRDASALQAYYANRGFLDVKVGQPDLQFQEDGIYITFQVAEGPRYTVESVGLEGELIADEETLLAQMQMDELAEEDGYFDRSVMRSDVQDLTAYYTNFGYAFADVSTEMSVDRENYRVNVVFDLSRRQLVRIRRVTISGNYKTRDNVIRREMRLTEGEQFSGQKLSRSRQALNKLNYFDSVDIQTQPTDDPGLMDLNIEVVEKSTGRFSLGVGYSSVDDVFVTGDVQETNLFGRGYRVGFSGSLSGGSNLFEFSFWNPHLYDGPVGAGFDLYNIEREYDEYDYQTKGGKLKFAYTLGEYTRLFWGYRLEQYTVDEIDDDASDEIWDLEGDNWGSVLFASIYRDTTDKWFSPTQGTKNTLSLEYGGGLIGGDSNYIKPEYTFSFFHPLFWKFVFHWHWEIGHLIENTDEDVLDFERFYLGGIDSVRGYEFRDISSQDANGEAIGGYSSFFTNLELIFPVKEDMGVLGVLFFDSGNVWDKDETPDTELFDSVGAGIRWNSPLGPLRLVYGYPLDDLKGNNGRFEFSIGTFF